MKSYDESLEGVQREIHRNAQRVKTMKANRAKHHFERIINSDEQTRINKYAEGFCYGCAKRDQVLSSLWFACTDCILKRGRAGIMATACRKFNEEFCDFCAQWHLGVSQINISMCSSCRFKVEQAHKKYREMGGRESVPFHKKMVRQYGKDYQLLLQQGTRKKRRIGGWTI